MSGVGADDVARAVAVLREAGALLFTAGAGMGVDSGLPDFRGPEGFWRAYPPYQKLGLAFEDLANPRWFQDDPALAWGFYGHRLNLYRRTAPHDGHRVLRRLAERADAFVFTSNVDGLFQRAGFSPERIAEVHGAIGTFQCTRSGCRALWDAPPEEIDVDPATFRARGTLPACPACGALARPNILMFGDWGFDPRRSSAQEARLEEWLGGALARRLVILECGAGTAVPTVRGFGEQLVRRGAALVRLNVREPEVPAGQTGIAAGARAGLLAIEAQL
jgi:NAD-dependent SIR2 family protein deacetylase